MKKVDTRKATKNFVKLIRTSCKKEGVTDVLIGVSGGVDSATSLSLTVKALGKNHVYPVLLPYGDLSNQGTKDAWLIINYLQIPKKQVITIDIRPFTDAVVAVDSDMDEGRRGNVMARMRMIVLFDLAKKFNRLVVGTENKSEHLLGYYTRFGDEASDIEPIRGLYKFQVYELAKFLNIPQKILEKSPTAGLWEGQTDEGEFGFSYKIADEILYLHFEKKLGKKEIVNRGFTKDVVGRVWWWIEKGNFKDRLPYRAKSF